MVRWNELEDEWNSHSLTSTGMNIVNDDSTRNKVPYFFIEPNARMSKPRHLRFLKGRFVLVPALCEIKDDSDRFSFYLD